MKIIAIIATGLALALAVEICHGADLNASGEKPITLGSEITRGADAVYQIPHQTDLLDFLQGYYDLLSHNKQTNKDTDGFLLGAKFKMWLLLTISIDVANDPDLNTASTVQMAAKNAVDWLAEARKKQRELAISDEQIASLIAIKLDRFLSLAAAWQNGVPQSVAAAKPQPRLVVASPPITTVADSQRMAVILYPDLAVAGSPMNKAFVARVNEYKASKPEFFIDPLWPQTLATEVGAANGQ